MGFGITFSPLVPSEIMWASIVVAIVAAALLLAIRSRGAWMRAIALACAALALANPSLRRFAKTKTVHKDARILGTLRELWRRAGRPARPGA